MSGTLSPLSWQAFVEREHEFLFARITPEEPPGSGHSQRPAVSPVPP